MKTNSPVSPNDAPDSKPEGQILTSGLLLIMTIATGVAVASNYYAQPLLRTLSDIFSVSETMAATLVTAAQLSYALGLIFLTPLGDIIERKRLIISMMLLSTLGLCISASANSLLLLLMGTALTGLFAVVAQVLIPYASTLVGANERGRVVGTLMSGLLLGILLARTFAGTISSISSWRMVYVVAAVIMLITTAILAYKLPASQPQAKISYPKLISSTLAQFAKYPLLRLRAALGGLSFAAFTILWTPLAYLLFDQYHFSDFIIGLFGLIGAAGALSAPIGGKMSDKGKSKVSTLIGILLLASSWVAIYFAPSSLLLLIIGIVVLDLAVQFVHVLNMSEVYKLDLHARSRLNAGYMFSYFLGGTLGSLVSAYAYQHYQWLGVSICGATVSILLLIIWLLGQNITTTEPIV